MPEPYFRIDDINELTTYPEAGSYVVGDPPGKEVNIMPPPEPSPAGLRNLQAALSIDDPNLIASLAVDAAERILAEDAKKAALTTGDMDAVAAHVANIADKVLAEEDEKVVDADDENEVEVKGGPEEPKPEGPERLKEAALQTSGGMLQQLIMVMTNLGVDGMLALSREAGIKIESLYDAFKALQHVNTGITAELEEQGITPDSENFIEARDQALVDKLAETMHQLPSEPAPNSASATGDKVEHDNINELGQAEERTQEASQKADGPSTAPRMRPPGLGTG